MVDLFGQGLTEQQIERYRKCAGAVVVNQQGLVFAGIRTDTPADATTIYWQMPQGGCDDNEEPEQSARRELWEETSIRSIKLESAYPGWLFYDLPPDLEGRLWQGRFRGQRQRWFCYRFHAADDEINLDTAHREFADWRWLSVPEVLARAIPFKKTIYQELFRAFSGSLGLE